MGVADAAAKSAAKAVAKFIAKTFWPWFLKNIWPLVATAVVAFVAERINDLSRTTEAAVQSKYEARAARAQESASEAESLAAAAATSGEREKHEATAGVWRTVAEQLRADNEQLLQQLAALGMAQQDAMKDGLNSLAPRLDRDGADLSLCISGSCTPLPALPSSSELLEG